ncbi:MAG: hypothetical protein H7A47_07545 [Verrucomicrobiales bacterium]|nr:hypothetical protein [Verrucomicrobiales bacterium]
MYNLFGYRIKAGVLGKTLKARAQHHQKTSWRFSSPNPDREKEINWRLDPALSLGIVGELGIHQLDIANWYSCAADRRQWRRFPRPMERRTEN